MRKIAALLVLLATWGSAQSADCPATEAGLIGAWSRSGDSGFFEEFLLESAAGSRTFNSWLHQGPEISDATWSLEDCQLVVVPQHEEFGRFRFKVIALENGKLRLFDVSGHIESAYVRLPDEA